MTGQSLGLGKSRLCFMLYIIYSWIWKEGVPEFWYTLFFYGCRLFLVFAYTVLWRLYNRQMMIGKSLQDSIRDLPYIVESLSSTGIMTSSGPIPLGSDWKNNHTGKSDNKWDITFLFNECWGQITEIWKDCYNKVFGLSYLYILWVNGLLLRRVKRNQH